MERGRGFRPFDAAVRTDHNVVEIFNNEGCHVDRELQRLRRGQAGFNETFDGQNKSAIIADLMLQAVERARGKQRSLAAYKRILRRRPKALVVTEEQIHAARQSGRP